MSHVFKVGKRVISKNEKEHNYYNYGVIIEEHEANEVVFEDYYTIRLINGSIVQVYKSFLKRSYKVYNYDE